MNYIVLVWTFPHRWTVNVEFYDETKYIFLIIEKNLNIQWNFIASTLIEFSELFTWVN